VLQRNIPEDWSVKDWTSCKDNLYLGREDDIIKIVQVEGAKCINTWGPTGTKGRPNRAGMGLGWLAKPAGLAHSGGRFGPPFLAPEGSSTLSSWRRRHSQGESHSHREAIHKLEREEEDLRRRIAQLEGSTNKWRRKKTSSEASPWSMVLCLAPWCCNLLICPWVVIDLEM
jgi:hypothetical protein